MVVAVGNDHAGFKAKVELVKFLKENNIEVIDVGTNDENSCHYPVFGKMVAEKIVSKEADLGVVICSSGEGIAMSVNKVKGVRCGIGYNDDVSRLMREHNDAQVISFGANFMSVEDIKRRTMIFLNTKFSYGERHVIRVGMLVK